MGSSAACPFPGDDDVLDLVEHGHHPIGSLAPLMPITHQSNTKQNPLMSSGNVDPRVRAVIGCTHNDVFHGRYLKPMHTKTVELPRCERPSLDDAKGSVRDQCE